MFSLFGAKPDHPMYDLDEAKRLLDELPQDDPQKSLEEITFWLDTIKSAAGFTPELRLATIMLLDEAGQPRMAAQLQHYLEAPHLRDFQGLHLWQGIHACAQALAAAYSASLVEYRQTDKKPFELRARMPLACVRQLQAVAAQIKLELMRYLDIAPATWQQLYDGYRFAEEEGCTASMVLAYPGHVIHTSPQRELLHALALCISSPATLAADQIEVAYRIAGRMASFFELTSTAKEDCLYQFDLASPAPPHQVEPGHAATAGVRYFGATKAISALKKIIDQNENDPVWQERRFGSEFTPAGKLTVLKHLTLYWAAQPPHRHMVRRSINATLEVVHGFRVISQLVTHIKANPDAEEDAAAAKKRAKMDLAAEAEIEYTTEVWNVSDMSPSGFGAVLTGNQGAWIKIGDLCGFRPENGQQWWVGMLRRLHTDAQGKVHVGIELMAKRPASVWLRVIGKGAERTSNWETSSGSFAYDYLPVILLPDEQNSYQHATLLMESGRVVVDSVYQMMTGDKNRDVKLTRLLAEGEDYEQAEFEWLT